MEYSAIIQELKYDIERNIHEIQPTVLEIIFQISLHEYTTINSIKYLQHFFQICCFSSYLKFLLEYLRYQNCCLQSEFKIYIN